MVYKLSHWLMNKIPFMWKVIEFCNEKLFVLRYKSKLKQIHGLINDYKSEYRIIEVSLNDVPLLVSFFAKQPQDSFTYFHPHEFDEKSLRELIKKKSFLMFLVSNSDDEIVGYFFLRCFFNGKCFRGKMVDYRWRGKGIAVIMGKISTSIANFLNLRMFGTISKSNLSSLVSSQKSNEIRIVEELPNDYLYIEYLPNNNCQ